MAESTEARRSRVTSRQTQSGSAGRAPIPFRLKLTIMGALLAVVPLAIIGYLLMEESASAQRAQVLEYQHAIIDDVARTIGTVFVDAEDSLDAIGKALTNSEFEPDARIALATTLVSSSAALDHAAIYDRNGALIDSIKITGLTGVEIPESLPATLCDEARRSPSASGTVTQSPSGPRLLLALPIRDQDAVTGFVATRLGLAPVQERVERLAYARFHARPDSLAVVDSQLRYVASADPELASGLADASQLKILTGIDPPEKITQSQSQGGGEPLAFSQSGEFNDGEQARFGTIMGAPTRGLAVVAQQDQDVVYRSINRMRKFVLIAVGAAIFCALIIAFIVARRITKPIEDLKQFAQDLANRKFDRRVTVNTRDELSILGDAMSIAAADLQASEERIKEEVEIRSDLGRYLPAELVDKVVRREQDMGLGGRRARVSILFADIVQFTPMTTQLSAEQVVGMLNELFTIVTEIVFRHGGTIDKFIGDCVMAMWGAPEPLEDHAERAVLAAEDMIRWLEAANAGWEEKYGVTIRLAIGINTGEGIVGNVGSETRMEYTAIGDVVNVAARLETIARPMQILVSRETRDEAGEAFEFVDRGERELSGRDGLVHLYEVKV